MSISVMKEGEAMGRGVKRDLKEEAWVRARVRWRGETLIAVLGAGPSGLLAAHAIALAGSQPVIFSAPDETGAPKRSEIGAATYLHKAIPDLTGPDPDGWITFAKNGTAAGYALKVYGSRDAPTSWAKFGGTAPAWNLEAAYAKLWDRYVEHIVPIVVTPELAVSFLDDFGSVVSTVPGYAICENEEHSFPSRAIWTTDGFTYHDDRDPLIVYDGTVGGNWDRVRSSRIFGKASTEYARPGAPNAREGRKILATDCDCHPEIVRAGRFGEWRPGVLTHHAFEKVWSMMFDNFEGA